MSSVALTYGRREWAIELLLLLAEGVLIWLVAAVAFAPFSSQGDPVGPLLAIGLVGVAGILPRALHDRGIWGWSFSTVVTVAIVLTTLGAVKIVAFPWAPWLDSSWLREAVRSLVFEDSTADIAVWAPIGLSAAVWWLARFNGAPGLERCRGMLRTGAGVAAVVAIGSGFVENGPTDREITAAVLTVFGATLIALAIARQGTEATRSQRRVLTTVLLPTVAILCIAAVLAFLVTFDWGTALPDVFDALGVVLDPIFTLLLLVLTGLVIVISLPILWLLSFGNFNQPVVNRFSGAMGQNEAQQSALDWHPPDAVRYLLATIVLIAIFYGVARFGLALTRRDFERDETGERSHASGTGLGKWFDRLRLRFGRSASDPLAGLRGDPDWAQTVRVREIYAAWLRWAEERKLGRDAAETADELDARSTPFFQSPTSAAALDELTAIYDDVRYGQQPATAEQADRAARAWQTLKSTEASAPRPS